MMEGDPLGSTTASPANPGLALVAGVTERKCKRGPHTSPTPATKRRPLWERERNERRTAAAEERPPISTLTWLLLVGVLLPPGTYRVARARACVCVVLRHQQRVTYDEKMEGQQQQQQQQQPNNRSRAGVGPQQQQQQQQHLLLLLLYGHARWGRVPRKHWLCACG
jgi:hypothetical protein